MPVHSILKSWLGLSRTRLFVAVVVPAVIGSAVAASDRSFSISTFLLVLVGLILVESSNLFLGDWSALAARRTEQKTVFASVNPPPTIEGSPMLAERLLPSKYTLHASLLCLLSASAVLVYFALTRGWPILFFGSVAVLIGLFYALSPIKYSFFSTALLPPLLTVSVNFVFTSRFTAIAFLAGLPLLFSSAGVIYTYRVLYDKSATGAALFSGRLTLLTLLYSLTFLAVLLLDILQLLPATTLVSLLALPILFYLVLRSMRERHDYIPSTSLGVLLYTVTGFLLALGILLNH